MPVSPARASANGPSWSLWKARLVRVSRSSCSLGAGDEARVPVPEVERRVAGEAVEVAAAVDVGDPGALAVGEHDRQRVVVVRGVPLDERDLRGGAGAVPGAAPVAVLGRHRRLLAVEPSDGLRWPMRGWGNEPGRSAKASTQGSRLHPLGYREVGAAGSAVRVLTRARDAVRAGHACLHVVSQWCRRRPPRSWDRWISPATVRRPPLVGVPAPKNGPPE